MKKEVTKVWPEVVRDADFKKLLGFSPSTGRRLAAKGEFPKRYKFTDGISGWKGQDCAGWASQRGEVV
jgi:predicted DNA-binding transcriptional regulator AlpA